MFQELADGVFRRRYQSLDANVGVVVGEEGLLIVDTRASTREGEEVVAELAARFPARARWVVNTHWHWDHVFGNSCFPETEIWGHSRCREVLADEGPMMVRDALEYLAAGGQEELVAQISEVTVVPPGSVFDDAASIDLGGRTVVLSHHGRGHTDADIVIDPVGSGVRFFGDLIEEGAPPSFGDSHPLAWPDALRSAATDPFQIAVPGHGDVMGPMAVSTQLEELGEVAAIATRMLEASIPLQVAARSGPYPVEVMEDALSRALETQAPAAES